jgi:hypothetical protein
MSNITTLATGQITAVDALTIELIQADETPAVVMIVWPPDQTITDPGHSVPWPLPLRSRWPSPRRKIKKGQRKEKSRSK